MPQVDRARRRPRRAGRIRVAPTILAPAAAAVVVLVEAAAIVRLVVGVVPLVAAARPTGG